MNRIAHHESGGDGDGFDKGRNRLGSLWGWELGPYDEKDISDDADDSVGQSLLSDMLYPHNYYND